MVVFKFIAVTTTGGVTGVIFEEFLMSLGESTATSNLHQLTCKQTKLLRLQKRKGGLYIEINYIIYVYIIDVEGKISPFGMLSR